MKNKGFAEMLMRKLTETEDSTLTDVWAHAALPGRGDLHDPEAMIGLLKGHDNRKDTDFLLAIFGKWEDFGDLAFDYVYHLWHMYEPMTEEEFMRLPAVYEVAFEENESDEPIRRLRWKCEERDEGKVISESAFDGMMINLVNTRIDSEIMKLLMGECRNDIE